MRRSTIRGALVALVAAAAGVGLAIGVGTAGADNAAPTTTTLGSTTGTPNQNICLTGFDCTYVPFASAANPGLQVPLNGSVTSFSVNSGSATGSVQLRVLRPAGNGKFTGVGTSPAQTLAGGPQTFTVSLPVQAGDVLALDNSSSALLFDGATANPAFTAYYNSLSTSPGLADGSTAAPDNNRTDRRLLLSAVVTGTTPTTSTSTATTTGTNGTVTVTKTVTTTKTLTPRPVIGNPTQARSSWRRKQGTSFAFGLGTSAKVKFVFRQRVGRRSVQRGLLSFNGHPGTNRRRFTGRVGGKALKKGRYTVTITATNQSGTSKPVSLSFAITG
jgi:hypothetical protein